MMPGRPELRLVPEPAAEPQPGPDIGPDTGSGTGPVAELDEPDVRDLGATIRDLRRGRGLTLAELARDSGLSIGLLSRLENGLGNPSLGTLTRLATGLGVPLVALFARRPVAVPGMVTAGRRIQVLPGEPGARHELLQPGLDARFVVSVLELTGAVRAACPAAEHPGTEFISVLRGAVDLRVGEESYRLEVGDSATYAATRRHHIQRSGRAVARLLYVSAPAHLP